MQAAAVEHGPAVPAFLRRMTVAQALVVGWAALLMFGMPGLGEQWWPWPTPEFTARFIGAAYAGALVPLVVFVRTGRWVPGRMVLWMNLVFTTAVMAVMFAYPGEFVFDRLHTWVYWTLYIVIPINSAVFLVLLRRFGDAGTRPTPPEWRAAFAVLAAVFGGYGLALLAVPEPAAAFWPWPVDDFHGRIYAAAYLSAAAGAVVLARRTAPVKEATFGGTLSVFGVFAILGVVVTYLRLPAGEGPDAGVAGLWAFLTFNALMAAVGAVLVARGRSGRAPAPEPAPEPASEPEPRETS